MFSEDLLDQVRGANPIYDVVSDYVSLKKSGRNFMGLCPFHGEKTPSFTVNPERQIFHCFGCGEGGNVIGFVMKREGMSFPEAVRFLAARAGDRPPRAPPGGRPEEKGLKERLLEAQRRRGRASSRPTSPAPPAGRPLAYLERRRITAATREEFGIGWAIPGRDALCRALARRRASPQQELLQAGLAAQREEGGVVDRFRGRVVFPIHDVSGRLVGFGGRLLADGEPKYLNSPETPLYRKSNVLYGLHRAKDADPPRGLRHHRRGLLRPDHRRRRRACANVVATSGTALTDGHAELMRRFAERWVVVFDGDAAGIRAAKRSLEVFAAHGLFARGVLLPDGADPDSFIRERGADAFRALVEKAEDLMDFFLRRIVQEHRIDTIEGKVAAVRETVPLLAKVRDRVAQADYLARAAAAPRRQGGGPLVRGARRRRRKPAAGRRRRGAAAAAAARAPAGPRAPRRSGWSRRCSRTRRWPPRCAGDRPRGDRERGLPRRRGHGLRAARPRRRSRRLRGQAAVRGRAAQPAGLGVARRPRAARGASRRRGARRRSASRASAERRQAASGRRSSRRRYASAEAAGEHETVKELLALKQGLRARRAGTA